MVVLMQMDNNLTPLRFLLWLRPLPFHCCWSRLTDHMIYFNPAQPFTDTICQLIDPSFKNCWPKVVESFQSRLAASSRDKDAPRVPAGLVVWLLYKIAIRLAGSLATALPPKTLLQR